MARILRIMMTGESTSHHVMSRTALEDYPMNDVDKVFFVNQVVKNSELKKRLAIFYDKEPIFYEDGLLPYFRKKLTSLSEDIRETKACFARFYNKHHGRRGDDDLCPLLRTAEYRDWLKDIKQQVAADAGEVNTALLTLYWKLGEDIVARQKSMKWDSGFLKQLSTDLMAEFPDMKRFSYRNIRYIRSWYLYYSQGDANLATACCQIRDFGTLGEVVDSVDLFSF